MLHSMGLLPTPKTDFCEALQGISLVKDIKLMSIAISLSVAVRGG